MNKQSKEQLATLLNNDTAVLLVTTGGVIVQRMGDADKTIVQFDALEPEAADALRAVTSHMLGLHETKVSSAAAQARLGLVVQFFGEMAPSWTPEDMAAAAALAAKGGVDVAGAMAAKAAAEAEATPVVVVPTTP